MDLLRKRVDACIDGDCRDTFGEIWWIIIICRALQERFGEGRPKMLLILRLLVPEEAGSTMMVIETLKCLINVESLLKCDLSLIRDFEFFVFF